MAFGRRPAVARGFWGRREAGGHVRTEDIATVFSSLPHKRERERERPSSLHPIRGSRIEDGGSALDQPSRESGRGPPSLTSQGEDRSERPPAPPPLFSQLDSSWMDGSPLGHHHPFLMHAYACASMHAPPALLLPRGSGEAEKTAPPTHSHGHDHDHERRRPRATCKWGEVVRIHPLRLLLYPQCSAESV